MAGTRPPTTHWNWDPPVYLYTGLLKHILKLIKFSIYCVRWWLLLFLRWIVTSLPCPHGILCSDLPHHFHPKSRIFPWDPLGSPYIKNIRTFQFHVNTNWEYSKSLSQMIGITSLWLGPATRPPCVGISCELEPGHLLQRREQKDLAWGGGVAESGAAKG